jgi:predicted RNase H-like nuclease
LIGESTIGSVGGIDGCRGGWVLVTTPSKGNGASNVAVIADLQDAITMVDQGVLAALAADIPIGLAESGARRCDQEARKTLGRPRASSVFPAPNRPLLDSTTYEEACSRSLALSGKSMSRQAFGILSKIASVDRLMTPEYQRAIVEVHPEVSFAELAGTPMVHHKATPEGRAERLAALRPAFYDIDEHAARRLPKTNPDDVLDAFVAAWTARRWAAGTHRQLGGDLDSRRLRMEMIV